MFVERRQPEVEKNDESVLTYPGDALASPTAAVVLTSPFDCATDEHDTSSLGFAKRIPHRCRRVWNASSATASAMAAGAIWPPAIGIVDRGKPISRE